MATAWRCEHPDGDVKYAARAAHVTILEEKGYTCVLDPDLDMETVTIYDGLPTGVVPEEPEEPAPEPIVPTTLDVASANVGATLSNGNLTVSESGGDDMVNVRANMTKPGALVYFEVTGSSPSDLWAEVGMVAATPAVGEYPGSEPNGWGIELGHWFNDDVYYHIDGETYVGFTPYIDGQVEGQTSFFAVNQTTREVWYGLDHGTGWMGGGDPALGTNPSLTYPDMGDLYPAAGLYDATLTFNFGATPFVGTVPEGFTAWDATP